MFAVLSGVCRDKNQPGTKVCSVTWEAAKQRAATLRLTCDKSQSMAHWRFCFHVNLLRRCYWSVLGRNPLSGQVRIGAGSWSQDRLSGSVSHRSPHTCQSDSVQVQTNWQPINSQRMMLWASRYGKQELFMDEVGKAHFENRESASHTKTLLKVAGLVGLDMQAVPHVA